MTRTLTPTHRITLHYRQGPSDKVYHAAIEPQDDLFVVNVAYGRRGSTLQTGTKTTQPVAYDLAERIFHQVVREKQAKGYVEAADGTPYAHAERTYSGLQPQLLNAIEETEAARLLADPGWCVQEKFDGQRRLVKRDGAALCGLNRRGLTTGLPSVLIPELRSLNADFVLDAEVVGEHLHVFDLLLQDETTWMLRPYEARLEALTRLLGRENLPHVHLVETAHDSTAKFQFFQRLRQRNAEGLVFKRLGASYEPGRPNSGGPALKFKFVTTASVIVVRHNAQRSVAVTLAGQKSATGNVTIPPNQEMPPVGAVIEVRYLYAFRESLALYQPVFVGLRDDVTAEECTADQLKFRNPAGDIHE